MRAQQLIVIVIFTVFTVCSTNSFGQHSTVYYGANSNTLKVAFADSNVSENVQAIIASDLRLCLCYWGKTSTLDLKGIEPSWVGYLDNPNKSPHYPQDIKFPKEVIANHANELYLQIPKSLSDAYTNAIVFASVNSNIVAAAYDFISFVSSTNFNAVTPNQISNYVYYNQAPAILYQIGYTDITNNLRYPAYYPPSILGFYYSNKGPAATNLWVLVPGSTKMFGCTEWSSFPAIWHDNRWKFCYWEDEPNYRLPP